MGNGDAGILMETAAAIAEEQVQGDCPTKPKRERVEFTPAQQEVFNRELARARRRAREEAEGKVRRDLFDTVAVTEQLLERCKDRISVEDECAIRDAFVAIRKEYQEKPWPKQQK